jgi:hypothetical protein
MIGGGDISAVIKDAISGNLANVFSHFMEEDHLSL